MKRMTGIGIWLALAALSTGASATEREAMTEGELVILPAGVAQYTEYRINTQKKAVLRDGTYNDVYVMKKPAAGNVFINVRLDLATEGEMRLTRDDLRLMDTSTDDVVTILPFDWFLDLGLTEKHGDVLTFMDRAKLEATFEVPIARLGGMVLFVGEHRVGTLSEVMERSPEII